MWRERVMYIKKLLLLLCLVHPGFHHCLLEDLYQQEIMLRKIPIALEDELFEIIYDRGINTTGQLKKIKQLIKDGVNIDAKGENGTTPLMEAVAKGNVELVILLLLYGADIDIKTDTNQTVFSYANNSKSNADKKINKILALEAKVPLRLRKLKKLFPQLTWPLFSMFYRS